jgi:hypothetical protein
VKTTEPKEFAVPQVQAGRHRGSGHARYATAPPRHATGAPGRRLRPAFIAVIATLAVTDALLGGLLLHQSGAGLGPAVAAVQLPRITVPAPATPAGRTEAPQRAQRQTAKVRPPVLLGPKSLATSLTAYCRAEIIGAPAAVVTGDGWQCDRVVARPVMIDMDAACRWLYGAQAWSGMSDDTDQQTWRCYRDPS